MSASIINPMVGCRDCGKLFMKFSRDICPECREKETSLIARVVECAEQNPRCDVKHISLVTGIPVKKICDLVHEGLLRRFGLKFFYPCRICGASIGNGSLCFWCSEKLYRLLDDLRENVWGSPETRRKIEAAGLRPDLNEEDWEKASSLFSDNIFRSRSERNIVFRNRRTGSWYR